MMDRIGRATALIVSTSGPQAVGITSDIVVRVLESRSEGRLEFGGRTRFARDVEAHLCQVVMVIVDQILGALGVEAPGFELSIVDTSGTVDEPLEVVGHSADVPCLLALLSAGLVLPLKPGIVSTGHMACVQGDVVPVRHLSAKIDAALADRQVDLLIYPAFEHHQGMSTLRPGDWKAARAALHRSRGNLRRCQVSHVTDLMQAAFTPVDIAHSSLRRSFFATHLQETGRGPAAAAAYLAADNDSRYWLGLKQQMLAGEVEFVHRLVVDRMAYFIQRQKYDQGFGQRLHLLLASLPPHIHLIEGLHPMASLDHVHALCRLAGPEKIADTQFLISSACQWEGLHGTEEALSGEQILEHLVQQLSAKHVDDKVARPLREARGTYRLEQVTVRDTEEFRQILRSFYLHVTLSCGYEEAAVDEQALATEAVQTLEAATQRPFEASLQEGLHAPNDGMHYLLNRMTDYLVDQACYAYRHQVIQQVIDPADRGAQQKVIAALIDQMRERLPARILEQPSDQWADQYEDILLNYVQQVDRISAAFQTV
jgi:hypothetical protein